MDTVSTKSCGRGSPLDTTFDGPASPAPRFPIRFLPAATSTTSGIADRLAPNSCSGLCPRFWPHRGSDRRPPPAPQVFPPSEGRRILISGTGSQQYGPGCAMLPKLCCPQTHCFASGSIASCSCQAYAWRPARRHEPNPPPCRDLGSRCRRLLTSDSALQEVAGLLKLAEPVCFDRL
jgi:hypothetical protein